MSFQVTDRHIFQLDRFCKFWYALIALLCLFYARDIADAPLIISFYAGAAGLFALLPYIIKAQYGTQLAVRAVLSCIIVPITFEIVGRTVPHVSPDARESWLIKADLLLFGSDPTRWAGSQEYYPFISEILIIAYSLFYFLAPILAIRLLILKKIREIESLMLVAVAGFLVSYFGYFLVPSRSPYHLFSYPFEIRGVALTGWLRDMIRTAESFRYDAFPSGHCEVTWLITACAWRFDRKIFYIFYLPVAILLPIATIYHRYHFGVDVIAAMFFAVFTWSLCVLLERRVNGPLGRKL